MLFRFCLAHRGAGLTGESINLFDEDRTCRVCLRQRQGRSVCGFSCFVLERALLTPLAPEQVAHPRPHSRQYPIVPRRNDALISTADNVRSNFDGSSAKHNATKHTTTNPHEETRQAGLRIIIDDGMERRVSYESVGLVIRTRPKEWLHSIALDDMLV